MRSFRSVRGEEEAAAREGVRGGGGGGGEAPRAAVVDSGVCRGPERILRAADRFGVGTRGGVAARCCEREKGRWLVEAAAAVLDEEAALRWEEGRALGLGGLVLRADEVLLLLVVVVVERPPPLPLFRPDREVERAEEGVAAAVRAAEERRSGVAGRKRGAKDDVVVRVDPIVDEPTAVCAARKGRAARTPWS